MSSYRPTLRAHLHVEDGQLADRLLERHVPLDGVTRALASRLDGRDDWATIRAAVIADGHAEHDVDDALRRLLLLHAVDGAGDALAARLERVVRREEAVPTSILDGARFACQGSGACCHGYAFGPLSDDDVAGLDRLDLAAAFPQVAPPYVEATESGRFLRRDGDRCIFLGDDQRCGLHARFGADAKPGFCRMYPLEAFGTVEGIRVVDRGTCATFAVSARAGLPLVDDLARVRPLFGAAMLHHPVALVDGWGWDYGLFLRFTTAATTLIRRDRGTASETLSAVGRLLDALAVATSRCPLEPGQPDLMVTRVLAIGEDAWYRPARPAALARGLRTLVELLGDLGDAIAAVLARGRARASARWLRDLGALIEHATAVLARDEAVADGPAAQPSELDVALRISMRQQLFGRHALVRGHAGIGLVRIGLIQLVALTGARHDAGARALTAPDLSRGHMLATRSLFTGTLDEVLVAYEPAWRELLDGLSLATRLCASAPAATAG